LGLWQNPKKLVSVFISVISGKGFDFYAHDGVLTHNIARRCKTPLKIRVFIGDLPSCFPAATR